MFSEWLKYGSWDCLADVYQIGAGFLGVISTKKETEDIQTSTQVKRGREISITVLHAEYQCVAILLTILT